MVEVSRKYVFDFDSTLTRVEALDVLAEMTLKGKSDKDEIIKEIQKITNLGIDGDISFTESLERRIKLLHAKKDDLEIHLSSTKKEISSVSMRIMYYLSIMARLIVLGKWTWMERFK